MKRFDPWILAAIATALLIRLINLDEAPLWFDEVWTAQQIGLSWRTLVPELLFGDYNANHLPLYFVLIKAWTAIAGTSPEALRLPSVFLSLVTVILTTRLAGMIVNKQAARWTAWLAALSPYLLHHAQEARMYPLMSALSVASIYLLARYIKGDTQRIGMMFILVNLALLATHYYAMFIVSAVLLLAILLQRRPLTNWLPAVAISGTAVIGVVITAVLIAGHQSGEIYDTGLYAFPGVVWSLISGYTLMPGAEELHALGADAILPFLPVALITIAPLLILSVRGLKTLDRDASLIILITLAAPLLAPFIVRVIFPDVSINPRYAMSAVPALLVLLGAGLAKGFTDHVLVKISALVLFTVLVSGSLRHLSTPGHGRADIYAAGNWLEQQVAVDEEILVTSVEMHILAAFHWPHRHFRLYPDRKIVANHENSAELAENIPSSSSQHTIFIFGRSWLSDPDGLLQDALRDRYTTCPGADFRGIRILCLVRAAN